MVPCRPLTDPSFFSMCVCFNADSETLQFCSIPELENFLNHIAKLIIEGFGGKRALGFLLKIELCRKRSKFRMQFCLGALNNVLYVFLLKFSSFARYYVCKKACICGLIST